MLSLNWHFTSNVLGLTSYTSDSQFWLKATITRVALCVHDSWSQQQHLNSNLGDGNLVSAEIITP